MKLVLNSFVFISCIAIVLSMSTQVQLGLKPHGHLYLLVIFGATLLEYNLFQMLSFLGFYQKLHEKNTNFGKKFISIVIPVGFAAVLVYYGFNSNKILPYVFFALVGIITYFYTVPLKIGNGKPFSLRQIPYLKIFLISFVWAAVTVYIPATFEIKKVNGPTIFLILVERFLFVFAITLPFDIRDMEMDQKAGIKTIPLKIGERRTRQFSMLLLVVFGFLSVSHYVFEKQLKLAIAYLATFLVTYMCIFSPKIRNASFYHYGILDGCLLLHGLLIIGLDYL